MATPVYIQEDARLVAARREILATYGHTVTVAGKAKSLHKFGRNPSVSTGAKQTVWVLGGNEVYPSGNTIDSVSSSDAGDTQSVVIEGHTLSGSTVTFVVQTVTLQGQTRVPLSPALWRANRMYNDGATDFAGTVYCYENTALSGGAPIDTTKIHLEASGVNNQSEKAATTLSSQDYWLVSSFYVSVGRQASASCDFHLEVRRFGKVFRTIAEFAADNDSGVAVVTFDPVIIIPPRSDIRVTVESSANNTNVTAAIDGYLALVTSGA